MNDPTTGHSKHVFFADGAWWFGTEDEGSLGPYPTADAAEEALSRYCLEFLSAARAAVEPPR